MIRLYIKNYHRLALIISSLLLSLALATILWWQPSTFVDFFTLNISSRTQLASLEGAGSGLVAWWKFDEGSGTAAADSSGNNNNGTLANNPGWNISDYKVGSGAISFNGVDNYINVGHGSSLNITSSGLTIAGWVKIDSNTAPDTIGQGLAEKASTFGLEISSSYHTISCLMATTNKPYGYCAHANTVVSPNIWHHIAIVQSPDSGITYYLDGKADGVDASYTGNILDNSSVDLNIGARKSTVPQRLIKGLVDDLRIYNRTLTAGEITALYNLESGGSVPINGSSEITPQPSANNDTVAVTKNVTDTSTISDNSVQVPTSTFDAALATNGGYAWNSYSRDDLTEIVDNDPSTVSNYLGVDNPNLFAINGRALYRGYVKISLGSRVLVDDLRIVQMASQSQASQIKIMTDDGYTQTSDISSQISKIQDGKTASIIPVNRKTSFINIYIENVDKPGYGPRWYEVNAYTKESYVPKAVSVSSVTNVDIVTDFSQTNGQFKHRLASTNVQAYVNLPSYWEFDLMPYWRDLRPYMQRTFIGDESPHNFGWDMIPIGQLSSNISPSQTNIVLANTINIPMQSYIRIDYEYMTVIAKNGNSLTVTRGSNNTSATNHSSNSNVYYYRNVHFINRASELLPEFARVKYGLALVSGVDTNKTPGTDTELNVNKGENFQAGEVIQIDQELMRVLSVNGNTLKVVRQYDGTVARAYYPSSDIYKIVGYSPYYSATSLNPLDPNSYNWTYWDQHFDSLIKGIGVNNVWLITESPIYMFNSRGTITSISGDIIGDSSKNWWSGQKGREEFRNGTLHILDGLAAGQKFNIAINSSNTLSLTDYNTKSPVDISSYGIKIGDHFKAIPRRGLAESLNAPSPEFWQRYSDFWYMAMKHLTARYPQVTFYLEFWNEPNIYGNWDADSYFNLYQKLSRNLRANGIPNIKIGAGSASTGWISGIGGDPYSFYEHLIKDSPYIDFISSHRYGNGDRFDKKYLSWEVSYLKRVAQSAGKNIEVYDSETNSVTAGGGTGSEVAAHLASVEVPYWGGAFVSYFYGDQGDTGRYDGLVHFRLSSPSSADTKNFGMFSENRVANAYWLLKFFSDNTTSGGGDIFAQTLQGGDAYGWVETMAYTTASGLRKILIVNKKETSISTNLSVIGISNPYPLNMDSVIGSGPNQTIEDGFHDISYSGKNGNGVIRRLAIADISRVVLEPHSFNIITLNANQSQLPTLSFVSSTKGPDPYNVSIDSSIKAVVEPTFTPSQLLTNPTPSTTITVTPTATPNTINKTVSVSPKATPKPITTVVSDVSLNKTTVTTQTKFSTGNLRFSTSSTKLQQIDPDSQFPYSNLSLDQISTLSLSSTTIDIIIPEIPTWQEFIFDFFHQIFSNIRNGISKTIDTIKGAL